MRKTTPEWLWIGLDEETVELAEFNWTWTESGGAHFFELLRRAIEVRRCRLTLT